MFWDIQFQSTQQVNNGNKISHSYLLLLPPNCSSH